MGKRQPRHMAPKAQRGVDMNRLGSRALVGALTVALTGCAHFRRRRDMR